LNVEFRQPVIDGRYRLILESTESLERVESVEEVWVIVLKMVEDGPDGHGIAVKVERRSRVAGEERFKGREEDFISFSERVFEFVGLLRLARGV